MANVNFMAEPESKALKRISKKLNAGQARNAKHVQESKENLKFLIVDMGSACFSYQSVSKVPSFLQNEIIILPCRLEIRGKSLIHLKPQRSSKTKC